MKHKIILEKMLNHIKKIEAYTFDKSYDDFIKDSMLVEACVFNLSQIGELVAKISKDFESEHGDIPWRMIYGLRNKIVHDYDGVNLVLIWDIIKSDFPKLKSQLIELSNQL